MRFIVAGLEAGTNKPLKGVIEAKDAASAKAAVAECGVDGDSGSEAPPASAAGAASPAATAVPIRQPSDARSQDEQSCVATPSQIANFDSADAVSSDPQQPGGSLLKAFAIDKEEGKAGRCAGWNSSSGAGGSWSDCLDAVFGGKSCGTPSKSIGQLMAVGHSLGAIYSITSRPEIDIRNIWCNW